MTLEFSATFIPPEGFDISQFLDQASDWFCEHFHPGSSDPMDCPMLLTGIQQIPEGEEKLLAKSRVRKAAFNTVAAFYNMDMDDPDDVRQAEDFADLLAGALGC